MALPRAALGAVVEAAPDRPVTTPGGRPVALDGVAADAAADVVVVAVIVGDAGTDGPDPPAAVPALGSDRTTTPDDTAVPVIPVRATPAQVASATTAASDTGPRWRDGRARPVVRRRTAGAVTVSCVA